MLYDILNVGGDIMFKDKLRELRLKENLSQEKLASLIYVSRSCIYKWKSGKGLPSDVNLKSLCDYFNISEEELISNKDYKEYFNKDIITNKMINIISIFGIIVSLLLFILSFVAMVEVKLKGDIILAIRVITSIADILNLKCIFFLLFYFFTLIISIFNLCKVFNNLNKKKMLIINIIFICLSILVFFISFILAII